METQGKNLIRQGRDGGGAWVCLFNRMKPHPGATSDTLGQVWRLGPLWGAGYGQRTSLLLRWKKFKWVGCEQLFGERKFFGGYRMASKEVGWGSLSFGSWGYWIAFAPCTHLWIAIIEIFLLNKMRSLTVIEFTLITMAYIRFYMASVSILIWALHLLIKVPLEFHVWGMKQVMGLSGRSLTALLCGAGWKIWGWIVASECPSQRWSYRCRLLVKNNL